MDIYIALVHHPVLSRTGDVVTTSVTNLDIHDLARIARTYAVLGYYVVTPISEQRELVRKVVSHWVSGEGRTSNPDRAEAFSRVEVVPSLASAITAIGASDGGEPEGKRPWVIGTSARQDRPTIAYEALRERLADEPGTALLVFGTGWGLAPDALSLCDVMLDPIEALPARAGYNHLPVRAACAIILDRLFGAR
jgi:hypothetical protein